MKMKSGCGAGTDGLCADAYRRLKYFIAGPITHIANLSIASSSFPARCKEAVVIPIFKNGDRVDASNYRPISMLNILSKILETVMKVRLTGYMTANSILSGAQYGFREKLSTLDAILDLTQNVSKSLDDKKKTLGVFLDLKKAFDTVSHRLLLDKLAKLGILGHANEWFSSYPVLFLLYINELCSLEVGGKIMVFADDTTLLFTAETWEEAHCKAELGLRRVKEWLDSNLLTLNVKKTLYLTFSLRKIGQPSMDKSLKLHGRHCTGHNDCQCSIIQKKSEIKYLGLKIDDGLEWKGHVEDLSKKIRKLVYIFKNLRSILDLRTQRTVYYALAQSLLLYGLVAYGSCGTTVLQELRVAQRCLIKVILKKPMRFPTHEIYQQFGVLSVDQLFVKFTLCKFFNSVSRFRSQQNRETRTALGMSCQVPFSRTTFGQRQYAALAPRFFNSLNANIRNAKSVGVFRRAVDDWVMEEISEIPYR
jgi:hypothetical protein